MKTVTIPTCANPFVVIVNGIKYTYPAGATVEVPDDVAEVIEQHEEAKPEPAPVMPPFASVPSSGGGGGLPVVELTTDISEASDTQVSLNAEESAALTAAYDKTLPCIIKYSSNGMVTVAQFIYGRGTIAGNTIEIYSAFISGANINLLRTNSGWIASCVYA